MNIKVEYRENKGGFGRVLAKGELVMKNVLEYLENAFINFSDKTAVIDENSSVTYSQLKYRSEKIGSFLCGHTEINKPIIVFADKGIDALCCFFGTVYAGCFYTLADPHLPDERLAKVQSILKSNIVLTNEKYYEKAKTIYPSLKIFKTEDMLLSETDTEKLSEIRSEVVDTMPLYINFTSGSSGVPKGVAVGHRSVIDFIDVFCKTFDITESDVIGNQAPFDFDVSVKDIYSSIKSGSTLVIIPREYFSQPTQLMDFIVDQNITTMIWAVSALSLINTFHILDYKTPQSVTKILFSGEVMQVKHLKDWQKHLPNAMFVNLYGPTEITCNCTYHIIDNKRDYESGLPIGKVFDNEKVMLLDQDNKEIKEPNTVGEICVGGSALALGYYNNPEQTAKAFVQNPLSPYYLDLMYRTGDLAKLNENGELVFCGRKDFQIKYMGHRVELEEIEKEIMKIEEIENSCCIFDNNKKRLYAFYIGDIDKKELHKKLKEKLPLYMIPNALRQIEEMPLTKNGKTDRKALAGGIR